MGESNENYSDDLPVENVPTPLELASTSSDRSNSPTPSGSLDRGSVSTPLRRSSPPHPPSCYTRSAARRRNRQRLRRMSTFPPSQLGAMAVRDESFCSCPQPSQSRDLVCKCGEDDTCCEWLWDKDTKSSASDLSDDGREVKFHVNYSSGTAAVKGHHPMTDRQHFWEIKMTTPVYGTDIMVGVGTGNVDLNAFRYNFCSLLGKDGESWGFSYFGRTHHKGDFKYISGSRFGQGSIIGVHLDMWHGAIAFYKNRRPLGLAYRGLSSKTLYPMVSSTAARTGMRLISSCSFSTSLQFLCCQVLRKIIPAHLDVTEALDLPPGLHAFLTNNLSWLLRPSELEEERRRTSSRKRVREVQHFDSDSDDDLTSDVMLAKRTRKSSSESSLSEDDSLDEEPLHQQSLILKHDS